MTCGSCLCRQHITNSVTGVSRPPVLDCGTTFHPDYGGRDLPATPSDQLCSFIYLATEALSDSVEFTSAVQITLSVCLSIWRRTTKSLFPFSLLMQLRATQYYLTWALTFRNEYDSDLTFLPPFLSPPSPLPLSSFLRFMLSPLYFLHPVALSQFLVPLSLPFLVFSPFHHKSS